MVGRLLVSVVAVGQERHAADVVEVAVHPVADGQPLVVTDVDSDRRVVLAPVLLEHQVVVKLLHGRHIVAEHGVVGAFHREAEYVGGVTLQHAVFDGEALRAHELCQRVLLVSTDGADVVLAVAGVDARGAVHELRDGARRLDGGDGHRLVDAQLGRPFSVHLDGVSTQVGQPVGGLAGGLREHLVVHDAGHGHAQQALFLLVLLPDAAHVAELAEGGLEGAHDGGHLDLLHQVLECVTSTDDHLGQVAEPSAAQQDLAAVMHDDEVRDEVVGVVDSHVVDVRTLTGLDTDNRSVLVQVRLQFVRHRDDNLCTAARVRMRDELPVLPPDLMVVSLLHRGQTRVILMAETFEVVDGIVVRVAVDVVDVETLRNRAVLRLPYEMVLHLEIPTTLRSQLHAGIGRAAPRALQMDHTIPDTDIRGFHPAPIFDVDLVIRSAAHLFARSDRDDDRLRVPLADPRSRRLADAQRTVLQHRIDIRRLRDVSDAHATVDRLDHGVRVQTRVGTEIEVRIATARLRSLLLRRHAIEDAALTGLRLDQGLPLLQEDLHSGTFRVGSRVVGQRTLGLGFPPLARLGHTHAVVRQVGQGDQGRAAHTAHHDDVSDLADEVVALDGVQLAAGSALEQSDGELEQVDQRLGARGAAAEGLQLRASGANLGDVPLGDLACVQQADHLAEGAGPSDLAVPDRDHSGGGVELLSDFGQLVDALALDAEADAGAAHQDVEDLVEGTDVVHGDVRAVVAGHLVLVEGGAGGHQGAHGGHAAE